MESTTEKKDVRNKSFHPYVVTALGFISLLLLMLVIYQSQQRLEPVANKMLDDSVAVTMPTPVAGSPTSQTQTTPQILPPAAAPLNIETDIRAIYYSVEYSDTEPRNKTYTFYHASANPLLKSEPAFTLILETDDWVTTDIGLQSELLYVRHSENLANIESLHIPNFRKKEIATIALTDDYKIGPIRYISDSEIGYIRYQEGLASAQGSVLEIISVVTGQVIDTFVLGASAKYAGFNFVTVYDNEQKIIVEDRGGDAGYVWSRWFEIDRTTKTVTALSDLPKHAIANKWDWSDGGDMATYPVTAKFSPDGTAFAYIDYSNKIPDSAFASEDVTWSECMGQTDSARVSYGNEGGVVKIYDLRTKLEREVYRQNSLHADNFCMLESRRLFGLSWISNDEIAVSDIEKVVSINIHNQTLQLLYTFDDFVKITAGGYAGVGPGDVFRSNINAVVSPYIYFNDLSVGVIGTDRSVSYVPNSVNSVQVIQY